MRFTVSLCTQQCYCHLKQVIFLWPNQKSPCQIKPLQIYTELSKTSILTNNQKEAKAMTEIFCAVKLNDKFRTFFFFQVFMNFRTLCELYACMKCLIKYILDWARDFFSIFKKNPNKKPPVICQSKSPLICRKQTSNFNHNISLSNID